VLVVSVHQLRLEWPSRALAVVAPVHGLGVLAACGQLLDYSRQHDPLIR
jgi:hypothetical protein